MSALGIPVLINPDRAYWLSSIGNDTIHSTITVDVIDANVGNISTLNTEVLNASTLNVSTLGANIFDVSGMYVSSIQGNTAFFSTMSLASDLSGGLGYVRFSVDASGIQVDGDPIRFDNLVYLTSSINIIQVSTLVDTDIFAQNGYFSTLSTGNLSANMVSLNQANISSLYVSSLEGFDISGADPVEWSLYPTLNSSITFQPGNVLSNVGSQLFFNGFDLTDISGGGQNWYLFPGLSTIDVSSNIIRGISTLRFQDGGTLTSATGNNLLYNGQNIQYGSANNTQNWANFPAVANVNGNNNQMSNVSLFSGSNLALSGSNITNGNTFTNSLGVGGTSLVSLATINSLGQLSCQDIDVGSALTGLADVNIYGATAAPGDSALYVQGGVQFDGGNVHGFSAGVIPVAGINTGRIDMLQGGFNLLHPLVGAITTGAAMSITSGGALSIAGGGYVEMNTSTLQMINTTSGNKNTTVQAGFLTVDPDIANNNSIKLFNTLGGGVEIDGGGQGSLQGFSTLIGANLSTINLNVSTINGVPLSSIQVPEDIVCSSLQTLGDVTAGASTITNTLYCAGNAYMNFGLWNNALGISTTISALRVNNIQIPDNITGITNAPNPLQSRIENFSSIQSGAMSTGDIRLSSINGINWNDISGGSGGTVSTFNQLFTSSIGVSSLVGQGFPGGKVIDVVGNGLNFVNTDPTLNARFISSLQYLQSPGINLDIQASTLQITAPGFVRLGNGSAFDTFVNTFAGEPCVSTMSLLANSTVTQLATVSTIGAVGGLPIKVANTLEFVTANAVDNVDVINLNPSAIPTLDIGASTILLSANNTTTQSLSTIRHSTSALSVSSINGNNPRPAYTNNLMLSTMELYNASTTLMYWSTVTTSSNINTSGYDVVPGLNGTYKIGTSFQFVSGGGTNEVEFFFLKNGTVITQSGGIQEVQNNQEIVSYVESVETLANGDTIQVGCYTTGTGVYVSTIQGTIIESPAVILTMYKVD